MMSVDSDSQTQLPAGKRACLSMLLGISAETTPKELFRLHKRM